MKYVLSNTGEPFQFNLGAGSVYSFDTEEPTAISEAHYDTIRERIGVLCLKEVDAPEVKTEQLKEEEKEEEAPASQE